MTTIQSDEDGDGDSGSDGNEREDLNLGDVKDGGVTAMEP